MMNNCRFIYAGSNRHILENMFNSSARPFYNSAQQLYLDRIEKNTYVHFAIDKFRSTGREITTDAVELAYDLFEGHTYYIHNLLHNAFAYVDPSKTVTADDISWILTDILEEKGHSFSAMMNQLNYQQKETLVAIAKEGKARAVTSVAFVRKHALKSPSSVQYAISTLLEKQLITYENEGRNKVYSVEDRFLQRWICRVY
jgi:AAA+ ATPase superfamily predicted ATPase